MTALLDIQGLRGGYGAVEVLRGVDLHVNCLLYTSPSPRD